jgi:hypothetical protein
MTRNHFVSFRVFREQPSQRFDIMTPPLRPEKEPLLLIARTGAGLASSDQLRARLREKIDWAYLLQTAQSHGLRPLLYWTLNAVCPDVVPEAILSQLRDHFYVNTYRTVFLTAELGKLLDRFEREKIPALPFKGPVLATALYDPPSLREFGDLDILVHRRDVLRVSELLASQGYRPVVPLSRAQETALLDTFFERVFIRDDQGVLVDLHWALTPKYFSFSLDLECLQERLKLVSLGDRQVPALAPEDLLLVLCFHGAKHGWERLGWLCDVARVISAHPQMDWEWIIERASTLGGQRMLWLGLSLAQNLLGAVLPGEVYQRIETDPVVGSLAAQVRQRVLGDRDRSPGAVESYLFYLRAMDKLKDCFRYCVDLIVTPTPVEWAWLPLPAWLFFLYYPVRAVRLVGKYGREAARRIRQAW